ncbi:MAG: P-II family nitrogen regulator [Zetaproteobacteria bacterium]|nr:MAG: P-II family nitrogen regulator [Zetaproteobacteria bacterium]
MHFKLIIAFVDERRTDEIMAAARAAGATGATVVNNVRGEGLSRKKSFFGLAVDAQRDVLMFVVEQHLSRKILERIAEVADFDNNPGSGMAVQLDLEDSIGLKSQIEILLDEVEEKL